MKHCYILMSDNWSKTSQINRNEVSVNIFSLPLLIPK